MKAEKRGGSTLSLFVGLFGNSHPNGGEQVSHCGFDLRVPKTDAEHFFICVSLEKYV